MTIVPIIVVSTNVLFRAGVQQILLPKTSAPPRTVMMADGFAAVSALMKTQAARVLIIDDSLPAGSNLVREVRLLLDAYPGVSVVLILQRPMPSLVQKMLSIGVRSILHKDDVLEQTLTHTIQLVLAGSIMLSPMVSHLLEKPTILPGDLDQRDADVLTLLTEGLQPKEIAARLGIGQKVVYRCIQRLNSVYEAQSVTQLVILAQQHANVPKKRE
jgi:DNA-binding NarL/FixJ family response regulator